MKKLLLLSAFAVFGLSNVNAQGEDSATTGGFDKGDLYVSGTVGFSSTSQGDAKMSGFTFSPQLGYFVTENIAIEAALTYGSSSSDNGTTEPKTTTFGGAISGMYYFTPANQFSFTVGLGVGYASSNYDDDVDGTDDVKTNGFNVSAGPGINYFVSDCLSLRAGIGILGYNSTKEDIDGAEAANTFALNLDLSAVDFGITYKFN